MSEQEINKTAIEAIFSDNERVDILLHEYVERKESLHAIKKEIVGLYELQTNDLKSKDKVVDKMYSNIFDKAKKNLSLGRLVIEYQRLILDIEKQLSSLIKEELELRMKTKNFSQEMTDLIKNSIRAVADEMGVQNEELVSEVTIKEDPEDGLYDGSDIDHIYNFEDEETGSEEDKDITTDKENYSKKLKIDDKGDTIKVTNF